MTRFGKGTYRGLLNDGLNSLTRYYLNNFQDGNKQNAMTLVSQKVTLSPEEPSPFSNPNSSWIVTFVVLLFQTFGPRRVSNLVDVISVIFWVFVFFFFAFIFRVNRKFILNYPTLFPKKKVD